MAGKAQRDKIDEKEWFARLEEIMERDREFLEAVGRL